MMRYEKIPKNNFKNKTEETNVEIFSLVFAPSLTITLVSPRSTNTTKIVVNERAKKYFPVSSAPNTRAIIAK